MKVSRLMPVLAVAAILLATPALLAEEYTVTLHNGSELRTLRQPQQASWDPTMAMVLTDAGNWIGVPQADIASIVSKSEAKGFGRVLDAKTIEVGLSPNDAPTDEELEEQAGPQDAFLASLERLEALARGPERPNVTVEQFVNPEDTTGLPTSYGNEGLAQDLYGTGYEP